MKKGKLMRRHRVPSRKGSRKMI